MQDFSENIGDVTEQCIHMFTEKGDADVFYYKKTQYLVDISLTYNKIYATLLSYFVDKM